MHNGTLKHDTRPILEAMLARKSDPKVVAALKEEGFASAETALTGRTARVQGESIRIGDVALFSDGGDTLVGEIYWFVSVGSDFVAGLSAWPVMKIRSAADTEKCML